MDRRIQDFAYDCQVSVPKKGNSLNAGRDQWQIETLKKLSSAPGYLDWQLSFFDAHIGGEMLELGCGIGVVTRQLLKRGARVAAVDSSTAALEVLEAEFADEKSAGALRVVNGDLESDDPELWSRLTGPFDSAIAVNFLEHLERDGAFVARIAERLRPGGRFLALVPAGAALYGTADRHAGHFRRYAKEDLRRLFVENGFAVRTLRHFNVVGALGWWFRFVLRKEEDFSSSEIGLMDRLTPLLRKIEFWDVPFGLSLVAVAEKV